MSEASRQVANLTERIHPHTPVYGVKEFVCLSVKIALNEHRHIRSQYIILCAPVKVPLS